VTKTTWGAPCLNKRLTKWGQPGCRRTVEVTRKRGSKYEGSAGSQRVLSRVITVITSWPCSAGRRTTGWTSSTTWTTLSRAPRGCRAGIFFAEFLVCLWICERGILEYWNDVNCKLLSKRNKFVLCNFVSYWIIKCSNDEDSKNLNRLKIVTEDQNNNFSPPPPS
jgi:hypothetical protein